MDTTKAESAQPKTLHRLAIRTAIGLFIVAALLGGYMYLRRLGQDIDLPARADTAGMIAAIQYHPRGSQAVLIRPDGTIVPSPGYRPGANDRDIAWRPDGNRVFFSSDREEGAYHMYRWNPASNSVERRSFGSRGHQYPSFAVVGGEEDARKVLVSAGGRLFDLDPKDGSTEQVLPPLVQKEQTEGQGKEGEGAVSAFELLYKDLGLSFKKARYVLGKAWIAAVMQREEGQVLVLQRLQEQGGQISRPQPIAAGQRVDFDVHPEGLLVFSSIEFEFPGAPPPEFVKNGRVTPPFRFMIGALNLREPSQPIIIVASKEPGIAFSSPTISPDGTTLLVVVGKYEEGAIKPSRLVAMPVRPNGGANAVLIRDGDARDPAWSPDGRHIAFTVATPDGRREIRMVGREETAERNLTPGKGSFGQPVFSPQAG